MPDDDDNDPARPPHLRVVSDNPDVEADRQAARAKEGVQRTLVDLAAALLRIMAGSNTESIYLMGRLSNVLDALKEFQLQFGRGFAATELEKILQLPTSDDVPSSDEEWRHRQWIREDAFDTIMKGALRLAAHKMLGEEPAFGGKHSKRVIEQGIESLSELKRTPSKVRRAKGLVGDQEDADPKPTLLGKGLGSPPETVAPDRKSISSRAAFGHEDLKELRKAIKAKDDRRIAELMAKIGGPSPGSEK